MKLQVLVDNCVTSYEENLKAEHGFSVFIEEENKNILFDCGATDLLLSNAKILQVDLDKLDYVVLSHHHYDHIGGLKSLKENIKLIEGPSEPVWLSEKLVFLGTIERKFSFESGGEYNDLSDDSALAYVGNDGLVIITGCSHSGICNIIEYAKKITNQEKVSEVLGGFHLIKTPKEKLDKIIGYLESLSLSKIYPGHCSDLQAKIEMAKSLPVSELGVGFNIEY